MHGLCRPAPEQPGPGHPVHGCTGHDAASRGVSMPLTVAPKPLSARGHAPLRTFADRPLQARTGPLSAPPVRLQRGLDGMKADTGSLAGNVSSSASSWFSLSFSLRRSRWRSVSPRGRWRPGCTGGSFRSRLIARSLLRYLPRIGWPPASHDDLQRHRHPSGRHARMCPVVRKCSARAMPVKQPSAALCRSMACTAPAGSTVATRSHRQPRGR